MQTPKAVIFDLGRVLVTVDVTRGIFALLNQTLKQETMESAFKVFWKNDLCRDYNAGRISPRDFYNGLCSTFQLDISYDRFAFLWCDVFSPMPGMEYLLRSLHSRLPIGLLSDTDPLHWQYLTGRFPMLGLIDKPTLSFETGLLKPVPETFLLAAKNTGVPPENCLYIDDLEENVAGARGVGMDAIHFSGAGQIKAQLINRGLHIEP